MAAKAGFRNVLGDITKQQNIPQKVAVVEAKVMTRLAAAKRPHPDAIVSNGQEGFAVERCLDTFNLDSLNVFDLGVYLLVWWISTRRTLRTRSYARSTLRTCMPTSGWLKM